MGNFIAIDLFIRTTRNLTKVSEILFSNEFFVPITIGGAEGSIKNLFLSGYAIEPFVGLYNQGQIASITVSNRGAETGEYLHRVKKTLLGHKVYSESFSPFEIVDEKVGISFFHPVALQLAVLDDLDTWLDSFPTAGITVNGYIDLVVADNKEFSWKRCYQLLFPAEQRAIPFITLYINSRYRRPNEIKVQILAQTMVWLHNQNMLSDQIGPEEADHNLLNLVSFTNYILHQENMELLEALLTLDGRAFHDESERINSAFSSVYPLEVNLV